MARPRKFTGIEEGQILLLYQQGQNTLAIAKTYCTSRHTVANIIVRNGGRLRERKSSRNPEFVFSGDALRAVRQSRQMTQQYLAEKIHCPKGAEQIRAWETETRTPSATYLLRILLVLRCYPSELLRQKDSNA